MSAKSKVVNVKSYNKNFYFEICLPDEESREVTIEVEALNENAAWDLLPKIVAEKYPDKNWFYTGRFIIKE